MPTKVIILILALIVLLIIGMVGFALVWQAEQAAVAALLRTSLS